MENPPRNEAPPAERPDYNPPQVERVMDADELAREVQYAGGVPQLS